MNMHLPFIRESSALNMLTWDGVITIWLLYTATWLTGLGQANEYHERAPAYIRLNKFGPKHLVIANVL